MSTRNFVPRANGEGSIGTNAKKWGDIQAVAGHIANRNIASDGATLDLHASTIDTLQTKVTTLEHAYAGAKAAATVADMTDHNQIYVYVGSETGYTNGNWYYWNGTAWTSGGVYNATALETDKTLTVSGAAADAQTVGVYSEGACIVDDSNAYLSKNDFYNGDISGIGSAETHLTTSWKLFPHPVQIIVTSPNDLRIFVITKNQGVQMSTEIPAGTSQRINIAQNVLFGIVITKKAGGAITVDDYSGKISILHGLLDRLICTINGDNTYDWTELPANPHGVIIVSNERGIRLSNGILIGNLEMKRYYAPTGCELVAYQFDNNGNFEKQLNLSFAKSVDIQEVDGKLFRFTLKDYNDGAVDWKLGNEFLVLNGIVNNLIVSNGRWQIAGTNAQSVVTPVDSNRITSLSLIHLPYAGTYKAPDGYQINIFQHDKYGVFEKLLNPAWIENVVVDNVTDKLFRFVMRKKDDGRMYLGEEDALYEKNNIPKTIRMTVPKQDRRLVILDTDWWTDTDDAMALRVLKWGEVTGKIKIEGIVLDAIRSTSVLSLSKMMDYEGIAAPVGADKEATDYDGVPSYHDVIIDEWSHYRYANINLVEDSTRFYQRILSSLPPGIKVDVISVGYTNALSRLFNESADSSLTDIGELELVKEKVNRIWLMGGGYETSDGGLTYSGNENNFNRSARAISAAQNVTSKCPVPITYLGFEVGLPVKCGGNIKDSAMGTDDLIYKCLVAHGGDSEGNGGRSAWDPMTVYLAIHNNNLMTGYEFIHGTNIVDSNGANVFTVSEDKKDTFVVKKFPDKYYENQINTILEKKMW